MESRGRGPILPFLILGPLIAVGLAILAFAPLWRCPGCDPDLDVRTTSGEVAVVMLGGSGTCCYCAGTKRASLIQRWKIRKESIELDGFTFPLLP
jgi:hypothetical protein